MKIGNKIKIKRKKKTREKNEILKTCISDAFRE